MTRGPATIQPAGPGALWSEEAIGAAATCACLLEASAAKPGNVTPHSAFAHMTYADFVASALAIGPAMRAAGRRSVGETILAAIESTRSVVSVNTNLGMVLLLAPLARAAGRADAQTGTDSATPAERRVLLRNGVASVLRKLDVEDARLAYRAIRLARPGGIGYSPAQDVSEEPSVSLLEAMRLASARDAVAREYASGFALTFDLTVPFLESAVEGQADPAEAILELFLELLARVPDSLVERKFGSAAATELSARAAAARARGARGSTARADGLRELDAWLRDPTRRWNPGTTADLVAAALFVWLLTGEDAAVSRATERALSAAPVGAPSPVRARH